MNDQQFVAHCNALMEGHKYAVLEHFLDETRNEVEPPWVWSFQAAKAATSTNSLRAAELFLAAAEQAKGDFPEFLDVHQYAVDAGHDEIASRIAWLARQWATNPADVSIIDGAEAVSTGNLELARSQFRRGVEIGEIKHAHYAILTLLDAGLADDAKEIWNLIPDHSSPRVTLLLATILSEADPSSSLALLDEIAADVGGTLMFHECRLVALACLGRWAEVTSGSEFVLTQFPNSNTATGHLLMGLYGERRYAEAISIARAALAKNESDLDARLTLWNSLLRSGRRIEGLREKAIWEQQSAERGA